jgi:nitrous oxidase accessory protein NosD
MRAGIHLIESESTAFDENIAYSNKIEKNNCSFNGYGINLEEIIISEISFNIFGNNAYYGIKVVLPFQGGANTFTQNNFIANKEGHAVVSGMNKWSLNGKGNYWDDYSRRYPSATQNQGIWSIPYEINTENRDKHPLVDPYFEESQKIAGYNVWFMNILIGGIIFYIIWREKEQICVFKSSLN